MKLSQQAGAALRHVVLIVVSVFGVLTQAIPQLHLPVAISSVMTAAYPILLFIEHYVADPSTGTPASSSSTAAAQTLPAPPPAPVP